jgi:hypothetical protein
MNIFVNDEIEKVFYMMFGDTFNNDYLMTDNKIKICYTITSNYTDEWLVFNKNITQYEEMDLWEFLFKISVILFIRENYLSPLKTTRISFMRNKTTNDYSFIFTSKDLDDNKSKRMGEVSKKQINDYIKKFFKR